jgi:hypothetical protein
MAFPDILHNIYKFSVYGKFGNKKAGGGVAIAPVGDFTKRTD